MWVAVDKDGSEVASNEMLGRYIDYIKRWNEIDIKKGHTNPEELYDENKEEYYRWTNESSNYDTSVYDGEECYNTVVYLPKGTIKLLTGKEMTWEDNPIEINEIKNKPFENLETPKAVDLTEVFPLPTPEQARQMGIHFICGKLHSNVSSYYCKNQCSNRFECHNF